MDVDLFQNKRKQELAFISNANALPCIVWFIYRRSVWGFSIKIIPADVSIEELK